MVVNRRMVKDLEKEVTSHCHLRHSNIVQIMAMVYDPMVECGIVLCFEKYGNIGQFLQNFEVPLAWKIELIGHINLGMNYLHTNEPPVIHGDLKTLNILVGDGFVAKVDFLINFYHEILTDLRQFNISLSKFRQPLKCLCVERPQRPVYNDKGD